MNRVLKVVLGVLVGALSSLAINGFVAMWQGITFEWDMPKWFLIFSVLIPISLGVVVGFAKENFLYWIGLGKILLYPIAAIVIFVIGFFACAFIGLFMTASIGDLLAFIFMIALFAPAVQVVMIIISASE